MKIEDCKYILVSILVAILFSGYAITQDGAELYKSCTACHSIGGGRMVGPDLKGISKRRPNEWLVKFIQSPVKVLNSGDADAKAIFSEYNNVPMPDNALSPDQINQILEFIDGTGPTGDSSVDPLQASVKHKIDSLIHTNSPNDIQIGKELFYGNRRFENEGASCISCHNASNNAINKGGLLAKDLTKAFSRLGGFPGIKGIIASPPFPSMMEAYKNNKITDQENAYLQLFLKNTDTQNLTGPVIHKAWLINTSLIVSAFITIAISLLWIKRKRRSVNHLIIKRQKRYSN